MKRKSHRIGNKLHLLVYTFGHIDVDTDKLFMIQFRVGSTLIPEIEEDSTEIGNDFVSEPKLGDEQSDNDDENDDTDLNDVDNDIETRRQKFFKNKNKFSPRRPSFPRRFSPRPTILRRPQNIFRTTQKEQKFTPFTTPASLTDPPAETTSSSSVTCTCSIPIAPSAQLQHRIDSRSAQTQHNLSKLIDQL